MNKKPIAVTLLLMLALSSLEAVVIDYRYGTNNALVTNYTGIDQAFLIVNSTPTSTGNYNTGGFGTFLVGRNNARLGVISFDLSTMQGTAGAIQSAQLTFFRTGAATDVNFLISMYQIYGTNAGWNQGTGNGTAVGPDNSVTYLNQNYSSNVGDNVPWQGSGGTDVSNFSSAYNPTLLDSVTYTTTSTSITFDVPTELVLSWINSPSTNAGLAFIPSGGIGNSSNANLGNSSAVEASRPLLSITYTAVPEPGTVGSLILGGLAILLIRKKLRCTPSLS